MIEQIKAKTKTSAHFLAILGNLLHNDVEQDQIDNYINWAKSKGFKLKGKPLESYNLKFTQPKESNVLSETTVTEEKPFDLMLAQHYVNKARNAKSRGIEFTLTLADMRKLLKTKKCFYTGQPLVFGEVPNGFTIDRVDNTIGYTKENSVACAHWVNAWKNSVLENTSSSTYITKENLFKILSKLS